MTPASLAGAALVFAIPFAVVWAFCKACDGFIWLLDRFVPNKPKPPEPYRSPSTVIEPMDVVGGVLGIPILLAGLCWALLGLAVFLSPLLLLWLVMR